MKLRHLGVIALLMACTGCYSLRYETNRTPASAAQSEEWSHNFIGLVTVNDTNVSAICGANSVATVENQVSVVNAIVGSLLPIWRPSTVRVTCASSGSSQAPAPVDGAPVRVSAGN
jgi:hypothetical protein